MDMEKILARARRHYNMMLENHGATAKGVDWNSEEAQRLRFAQLAVVCAGAADFTINDYGCGYGALVEYLNEKGFTFRYRGFDISREMVEKAREMHAGMDNCEFFADESLLAPADYTVVSGVFNVKLETGNKEWKEYVLHTLAKINTLSVRGFAFNILSTYSDPELSRPVLYYEDPCFMFDYCKSRFSRHVSLLHDYGLYEFTLIVRKDPL